MSLKVDIKEVYIILLNYPCYNLAGETSGEELKRKGQTENEREQKEEN